MTAALPISRWKSALIWGSLVGYVVARLCQLWADHLPSLFFVLMHVVPAALFALVHGSVLYGRKGIAVFTLCCLGVGGFFESLSLRTGFPFGHYYFTGVMGPKLFGLPVLLVLAYLGIGYCAWILALLILGYRDKPIAGARAVALPVLAAFLMLAWDLAMDPDWGTVDRAWIWRDGGAFFGVPVSNFFGWYLTALAFYALFALYLRSTPTRPSPASRAYWCTPILFYAACATGNLLILRLPLASPIVTDASGRQWITAEILAVCALVSLLVMLPMALLALLRLREDAPFGSPGNRPLR